MASTTEELVMAAMAEIESIAPLRLQGELEAGEARLLDVREPME